MPSTPSEPLVLDPGPQPRRRSRPSCRCFLWLCLTLFCIISIYLGFLTLRTIVNLIKSPHSHQFQDLNILYSPNDVVKPLVDSNQTFDVVATVWLRQPIDTTLEGWHGAEGSKLLAEEAIYSDTIFRGLHLKDKNIRAAVNLSIPTEILCVLFYMSFAGIVAYCLKARGWTSGIMTSGRLSLLFQIHLQP